MPPAIHSMTMANRGCYLVTGKTGSGKSTTLAAMIDCYQRSAQRAHSHRRGSHRIRSPAQGLSDQPAGNRRPQPLLRRRPAFGSARRPRRGPGRRAARSGDDEHRRDRGGDGHSGHGNSAHQWRRRKRSTASSTSFPRTSRSTSATCSPRPCGASYPSSCMKTKDGSGRVAALEILINNSAVGNLIRQGKLDQLENVMQSSAAQGMQTMDGAMTEAPGSAHDLRPGGLPPGHRQEEVRTVQRQRLAGIIPAT